jgi:hypothetical protein
VDGERNAIVEVQQQMLAAPAHLREPCAHESG